MSSDHLAQNLATMSQMNVDLVINDNRTTMISILRRKRNYIKLSVHRMFLGASDKVVEAMVDFIRSQKTRNSSALLRDYINTHLPTFSYEDKIDPSKLVTMGEVYDLKLIYHKLNRTYFKNKLDLNITWYGMPKKKKGRHMTYGLYQDTLKLVKIHRLLDRRVIPSFYVEYVVFHEMLHAVYKPTLGEKCTHIHTPAFKRAEKQFEYFDEAIAWEKKSQRLFFR